LAVLLRAGTDAEAPERPDEQILVLVVVRIRLLVGGGHDLQLLIGLCARHAGLEASDDDQRVVASIGERKAIA